MIHKITSSLPGFKEITFNNGLNILLADKTIDSTEKQTRNGAGKSSLVELIHFILGSNCNKDSLFRNTAISSVTFGMEFDLAGKKIVVERIGESSSKIVIHQGDTDEWPITPAIDKKIPQRMISNVNWRSILGTLIFKISTCDREEKIKFGPTFRSIFSYFVRRQGSSGFTTPEKHSEKQQLWDSQASLSFLLDLDWTLPQRWALLRERERTLEELLKASKSDTFGNIIGKASELRTKLVIEEERIRRFKEDLSNFKVLPEYKNIEVEASKIARKIAQLANENTIDDCIIKDMEESLQSETAPCLDNVAKVYQEAGVILSGNVYKRFDEVRDFHLKIIENRKVYLKLEIQEAIQRILNNEKELKALSERQSEIMGLLKTHGALDQFIKLQTELAKREASTEMLRRQYGLAEELETGQSELELQRNKLHSLLKQDIRERKDIIDSAIIAFEQISSKLYENAGSLFISDSANGPAVKVMIQGSKSKGINNMQIFCFDLMLMQLCTARGISPGFLIHDSHLFDGVDERQVAKALEIGAIEAKRLGFQYIITMNSDALPDSTLFTEINIEEYILPVKLTDATQGGGLFGLRF